MNVSAEIAIVAYLANHSAVKDLVSNRIFSVKAADPTPPYVVVTKVSQQRFYHLTGSSELSRYRFQISCFAKTYVAARQVAEVVRTALEAWPGADSRCQLAHLANEIEMYEADTGIFHTAVDFWIVYED